MHSQKIALFGNPGETTEFLIAEGLKRGHNITLIVPDVREFAMGYLSFKMVKGDARKIADVQKFSTGSDVVICAYETDQSKPEEHLKIMYSVIEGVKKSGVNHLVFAAHRFEQPSERTEGAYNEFKLALKAQRQALELFRHETELRWVYAHSIEPEQNLHTGNYPTIMEVLFTTREGVSRVPMDEYASVILDEAERDERELLLVYEDNGKRNW
jgi:putative NADH-flavin reductase